MQAQSKLESSTTLDSVRRRGQSYIGYLLWAILIVAFIWTANAGITLVERCFTLLQRLRFAIGLHPPATGPDWWLLSVAAVIAVMALLLAAYAYRAYRGAWNRRLEVIWGSRNVANHTTILRLPALANDRVLLRKSAYLSALIGSRGWKNTPMTPVGADRKSYCDSAEAVLREVETDIAHRAITVGFVIGLNRNALIDSLTIAASALELQLHVLTRLGKRPSLSTWTELVKRSTASIFLNTYVTREDALYLNLAIRKAALGLEVASDAVQGVLDDVDLDEVLGHTAVPGLSELTQLASMGVSVGASGLRQIGNFVEHSANDLLQGVLAAGILYYHGMAVAAECLALDEEHRRSPEMSRTIPQAMAVVSAPAGRLLRDQVRTMRKFLRERRRQIFTVAKENVGGAAGKVRDVMKGVANRTTDVFRRQP